jgi:hypothetical protein
MMQLLVAVQGGPENFLYALSILSSFKTSMTESFIIIYKKSQQILSLPLSISSNRPNIVLNPDAPAARRLA